MENQQKRKRRVTCRRKYPTNELFKKWLEELRDKAQSNGQKNYFTYSKAVKAIENCPLELKDPKDAKDLDGIGDKTVDLLTSKLRQFTAVHGDPNFENIKELGIIIDDPITEVNPDDSGSPKKKARKTPNRPRYIPGYRTGGYGIILALYDEYKAAVQRNIHDGNFNDLEPPFIGKQELQLAAQPYCDKSLTVSDTAASSYTAWSSVNTLLSHNMVRMNRMGGTNRQYALTKEGLALAEQLALTATANNDNSASSSSLAPIHQTSKSPPAKRPRQRIQKQSKPMDLPASQPTTSSSVKELSPTKSGTSEPPWNNYDFQDDAVYYDPTPFDYDFDIDVPPLSQRISDRAASPQRQKFKFAELGYVYVDSDGRETNCQDHAYIYIEEAQQRCWYLVKTTAAYLDKVERQQWRQCEELPSFVKTTTDGYIHAYLKSDVADAFAPGINVEMIETNCESDNPKNGNDVQVLSSPDYGTVTQLPSRTGTFELDDFPSTSAIRPPEQTYASQGFTSLPSSLQQRQPSFQLSPSSANAVVLEPGGFEILLLVDHAEVAGGVAMFGEEKRNRKAFLIDGLAELKIEYEQRKLAVGDYLFIAREKNATATGSILRKYPSDRELVLGPIIERKRMDDLASSIKDGRFHEQKSRLHCCGVYKVIYLIEEYGRLDTCGMPESALRSAIVGTQVSDGFDVIRKKSPQESATYMSNLLVHLREKFGQKRLVTREPDSLSARELIEMGSDEIALLTFREFSESSTKRRILTVGDAFARCLMQFSGMSVEKAEAIRKAYPTLSHLVDAYKDCDGDQAQENAVLEFVPCGTLGRNLGPKLSKEIARFFCARDPFVK